MSTVSAIVINDNQIQFVMQAVESVLAQTFGDIEIIIIDCGETDDTSEAFGACQDRITYIRQPGQGLVAARAAGLKASAGTYLLFIRADDLLPPKKVELQIKQLEARPELGLAYWGGQIQIGEATQIIREVAPNQPDAEVAMEFLLSGCPLIRRDCAERAGLLEASSGPNSDRNPWQQISIAGYEIDPMEQLVLCKEHLTVFLQRLHRGDISAAQRHMIEAVRLSPSLLEEPGVFISSVCYFAKNPDIDDPVAFVQTVLNHLPDCARKLERFRPRILAELLISSAFQNYSVGDMSQVRQDVVAGLSHDLSYLRNRGVVSIFCKSLLNRNGGPMCAGRGKGGSGLLPSVIEDVQEALGRPVDSVERARGGTNRNTYLVRSGGLPFILRLAREQPDTLPLSQVIAVIERVRAVGVPAPSILAYNCPSPDTPGLTWTLEEWVPGHPFVPQNMAWRDALSVSTELGQYLRRLHSVETRGFGTISSGRLEATYQTFGQWLDAHVLNSPRTRATLPAEALTLIEAACQVLSESYLDSPRLCHSDLNSWNILIAGGRLSGVIDWEGVHGGDPASDAAIFHFWIDDEQILATLLQAYAPAEPEIFRRRVGAAVICYAASLLAFDLRPTIDRQALYPRCLKWLTDDRILSSVRLGR